MTIQSKADRCVHMDLLGRISGNKDFCAGDDGEGGDDPRG